MIFYGEPDSQIKGIIKVEFHLPTKSSSFATQPDIER